MQYEGRGTDRPALVPARGRRGNRLRSSPVGGSAPAAPPPPARPTHLRPARPGPGPGAAQRPRPNKYTRGECAGEEGGLGRGPQAVPPEKGGREPWPDPPYPLPPLPPPAGGPRGQQLSGPRWAEGTFPLPSKGPRCPGRDAAEPARHVPQRPRLSAPAGAAIGEPTCAGARERRTDHNRGQHANTNRSSMGATPSIPRATPMVPAMPPAQGRQRGGAR